MSKSYYELTEKLIISPLKGKKTSAPLYMIRRNLLKSISVLSLIVIDISALIICLALSYQIRIHVLPALFSGFPTVLPPVLDDKVWWILAISILCLAYEGLYIKRYSFWQETWQILRAITLAFVLILAIVSLAKLSGEISRTVLVITYLFAIFILPFSRYIGKHILARTEVWNERLLILGTGDVGKKIAAALVRDHYLGYTICGFLEKKRDKKVDTLNICAKDYPVLGEFKDAARIIDSTGVRKIIIAAPELPGPELVSLTNQLQQYTRSILLVPDLFGIPVLSCEANCFFDEQILAFSTRNNLASRMNIIIKYLFDLFVGALIFVLLLPIMMIIACLLYTSDAADE